MSKVSCKAPFLQLAEAQPLTQAHPAVYRWATVIGPGHEQSPATSVSAIDIPEDFPVEGHHANDKKVGRSSFCRNAGPPPNVNHKDIPRHPQATKQCQWPVEHATSFVYESPLKRPAASETAECFELPLKRPKESQEHLPFSDLGIVFAVDVSGSTHGPVLKRETEVISTICSFLSEHALSKSHIIPWSDHAQALRGANQLSSLYAQGGTVPSEVFRHPGASKALNTCSIWLLLTDGLIDGYEIRNFTRGLCDTGVHGTSCVVVLFGYKPSRPIGCNVSVGLSVFSHAPDCLFLFYDIDTSQTFVLQAKGCFASIINQHQLTVDANTLWKDLPFFSYAQLADLSLPKRRRLDPDEILLQDRQKIRLSDLAENRATAEMIDKILANDDNLKSVLLSAQIQGQDDQQILAWLSRCESKKLDVNCIGRSVVDVGMVSKMKKIIELSGLLGREDQLMRLKLTLRQLHRVNRTSLRRRASQQVREYRQRNIVLQDSRRYVSTATSEALQKTYSPAILSAVSPGGSDPTRAPRIKHAKRFGAHDEYFAQYPFVQAIEARTLEEELDVIYIPGYQLPELEPTNGFVLKGECSICGEENVTLAIMLKAPPKDFQTPDFPAPGSRRKLAYPLAMGFFPETDVISSRICCDACAYAMTQKEICEDEEIVAAIPVMLEAFDGRFDQQTFERLDMAFQGRFHESIVQQIFISTLHATIDNVDSSSAGNFRMIISWLGQCIQVSPSLAISLSSNASSSSAADERPLIKAIIDAVDTVNGKSSVLLQYPITGFSVAMQIYLNNRANWKNILTEPDIDTVIWHRLLFHFVEKHHQSHPLRYKEVVEALEELTLGQTEQPELHHRPDTIADATHSSVVSEVGQSSMDIDPKEAPTDWQQRSSDPFPALLSSQLLSDEELEDLQRTGWNSQRAQNHRAAALLKKFLDALQKEGRTEEPAIVIFDRMRESEELGDVFVLPTQEPQIYPILS